METKLNVSTWKEFKLGELFTVSGTKTTTIEKLEIAGKGEFPYVTTQSSNNGVSGFYNLYTEKSNVLVIESAVRGFCSYQEKDFSASDHVEKLIPNFVLNKYIALFFCTLINKNQYRFSYGRKSNQEQIRNIVVKLPICSDGSPDYSFMEKYSKNLWFEDQLRTSIKKSDQVIDSTVWKDFFLEEIFNIKYGVNLELVNCEITDDISGVNFVARTAENNGVVARVMKIPEIIPQKAGTISLAAGGSVLSTFVQAEDYYSGRDLYVLTPKKEIDIFAKLFLCTIIKVNAYKYAYGRQANKTLKKLVLMLPVKTDGTPDFEYMSSFMNKLKFADLI
jgi:hypothetical protein